MSEQHDVPRPQQEHRERERPDPRVSTVPLETEDGEEVVIHDNAVWIDGEKLDEGYLPDGTVINQGKLQCTNSQPCVVPEDSVWVMGDNRDESFDSRYFGPIEEDDIVGRAFLRIWPLNSFGFL